MSFEGVARSGCGGERAITHTTICLRPSRGLRMNLRVRRVTGESLSAMVSMGVSVVDGGGETCGGDRFEI